MSFGGYEYGSENYHTYGGAITVQSSMSILKPQTHRLRVNGAVLHAALHFLTDGKKKKRPYFLVLIYNNIYLKF